MEASANGRREMPRLRDMMRSQRQDYVYELSTPDLDYIYDDTDSHATEISELYSYTEHQEFKLNYKAFEELMAEHGNAKPWIQMNGEEHHQVILRLLDLLEVSQRAVRMNACRACLYLVQGTFTEVSSLSENSNDDEELVRLQKHWMQQNVFLFYKYNIFAIFVDLLNLEIENIVAAETALMKPAVSLDDNKDLRVILSVLYTMVEVMRVPDDSFTTEMIELRTTFIYELGLPIFGDELLAIVLFWMVTKFCTGNAPHFPMKKVLLLLWKTILLSLGGIEELRKLKAQYREEAGLPVVKEDTLEISRTMRAASPPASAADAIEAQQQKKQNKPPLRRDLMESDNGNEEDIQEMDINRMMEDQQNNSEGNENEEADDPSSRPSTPIPSATNHKECFAKGLPWTPKVRLKDIDSFLHTTRHKFVGFNVPSDRTSLAGLPKPIHEGLRVLNSHIYESLAEVQIKREEEIRKNPLSKFEKDVPQTPTEVLYRHMFPHLPQYVIGLLKILLAAAPTSKSKMDSINIMADVLPEEMPVTVLQSMMLGIDVNRHKEIIVKSISGILLLLMKHFKLNHIYQFEFMCQQLMFANCIPLVLKFFNQDITCFVGARNSIPIIDFPLCVLKDFPDLTDETLRIGDNEFYCSRNIFSCINLLRVLNKLTKWKRSRTMMLVVIKSAPILKRALKVRHAMMQLYVLKLLKMQTKYLGRQWRKSNMKTVSAIYQKVRHRLNDDWAYGNDMDSRPWDYQAEEFSLQISINRFHSRRYDCSKSGRNLYEVLVTDCDYRPVDNCIQSVLGQEVELTDEFKQHYEKWLQQEVYNMNINWDVLISKDLL